MSRLEVRPIDATDVPVAAALLARRQVLHRRSQPLLSARYEDVDVAAVELAAALAAPDASGTVASRGGEIVGFLVGSPKPGDVWGPNVWVEAAGQAVTDGEVMRDLYAVAATRWFDEARTAQYVLVPAHDADLMRAWYRLGFGQQHAHGIQSVRDGSASRDGTASRDGGAARIQAVVVSPTAVTVRRAVRDDISVLAELDLELPRHQGLAPTFSSGQLGSLEENIAEWEEDFDDPDYATFVAVRNGTVIGSAIGCALTKSGSHVSLARPDNAGFLGFAAVFGSERGSGAGRALGEAVLDWAADSGFDSVVTDWRVTNLLSSRAWPALGFTETFIRLHRHLGY